MKLSKNRNVKIISRPCWCPHQHAHTGPALRALPPRSPSARVGVLTNTLTQGTQLHPSRRSSRGTKRSHGMSAFTRAPRKKHLAQSRSPLSSSALTFPARVGVLTNTLAQGTQHNPSRSSSRGTKRSHGMSAFTREPRKKHLAQSRAPLPSSALTFRPCWCPHQHAHAAQVTPMLTQIILNK